MNRKKKVEIIDQIFDNISSRPEQFDVEELICLIEAVIPVHVSLEIKNFDEVDELLSLYPYLYQKMIKLYAYFIHKVRIGKQRKYDKDRIDMCVGYRDCIEQLIKSIKLQYDSLSRRITNNIERR